MNIEELALTDQVSEDEKLNRCLTQMEQLLEALRLRQAPEEAETQINEQIRQRDPDFEF